MTNNYTYETTFIPSDSPWGRVDQSEVIISGVVRIFTAGHGGIYLSKERQRMLPAFAKRMPSTYCPKPTWWEEDCEAIIPLYAFYDEIPKGWIRGSKAEVFAMIEKNNQLEEEQNP